MKRLITISTAFMFAVGLIVGCGPAAADNTNKSGDGGSGGTLTGSVAIDGSSTVYPITQSVVETFKKLEPKVQVTISVSGTGGGFKKFYAGDIQISNASRPIKEKEAARCAEAGIAFIELPVAYDGLAVCVNPQNDWCDHLTVAELHKIWEPDSKISNWSQIRAGFPDVALVLYGPGADSGTFDYFTEVINGKSQVSRADYTKSEDDNTLVKGIAGDKGALGYFGLAYYESNKDAIKLLAINDEDDSNGEGAIKPNLETVANGTYQPLARPVFIYISVPALDAGPEVKAFIDYYLNSAAEHSRKKGYVPLPKATYDLIKKRFANRTPGSMYEGGEETGVTLDDRLKGTHQQ